LAAGLHPDPWDITGELRVQSPEPLFMTERTGGNKRREGKGGGKKKEEGKEERWSCAVLTHRSFQKSAPMKPVGRK